MPDPRLIPKIRERLERFDYHAVFACGECFRFALRLHERFGYRIRGVKVPFGTGGETWSHVWAHGDSRTCIDINGVYEERLLTALCGSESAPVYDADPAEIRSRIRQGGYPPELDSELYELADKIFDSHERFIAAKPTNLKVTSEFLEELNGQAGQS